MRTLLNLVVAWTLLVWLLRLPVWLAIVGAMVIAILFAAASDAVASTQREGETE